MIESDSTLASFPLTLTKQIARNNERVVDTVRQEVEESIANGFRSEERKSIEEQGSPLAEAQSSQNDLSPNDDPNSGGEAASREDGSGDQPGRTIGTVFDDIA